ncbi:MAG: diaminopimelate epimerase [Acidobacteriota bacterium]
MRDSMTLAKVQAYGNDFLYVESVDADAPAWPEHARRACARQTGIGADGLIVYRRTPSGASMRLFNADGSPSEVSGNGVRGLAALLVWQDPKSAPGPGAVLVVETDAGPKSLELLERQGHRLTFRAAMGAPTDLRRERLEVGGERLDAVVLRVGNPQCVLLEPLLDEARFRRLGPLIERHPAFPARTNVEFARVESRSRVRILIWERGVGPTQASGTGACAAAAAAMHYAGADPIVEVESPGGTQVVEWRGGGLYLTGCAEVVWEGRWIR